MYYSTDSFTIYTAPMEDAFCTDCKKTTLAVLDHVTGDLICTECALVLESYLIDDTPEWRIFNDDSKDNDPIRVGQPTTTTTSVLLGVCDLSTVITLPNGKKSDFLPGSLACRKQNQGPNPDNSVIAGLNTIADMVDRLGLIPTIKDRACEIYTKLQDQKRNRGRNHDAILVACLYVACKQENKPRTVKELCAVANGTTMKEFLRAKNYIVKQLQADMGHSNIGVVHAGDFLRRFCSHLGMNFQSVKAAQETVQKIEESDKIDIRRNPLSIAAAVIYMITRLSKERKPAQLREVSVATGVAEGTIRNAYKDLYLHVSTIIPCWFAKKEDLRNL